MTSSASSLGRTQDIPPVLALALLALVVGGLYYLDSPTTYGLLYDRLDFYASHHTRLLTALGAAIFIDLLWLLSIGSRIFGKERQGSRLESITGSRSTEDRPIFVSTAIALALGITTFGILACIRFPSPQAIPPIFLTTEFRDWTARAIRVLFAWAAFVLASQLTKLSVWRKITKMISCRLPVFPEVKDTLVLGSAGEEGENPNPHWATMGMEALYGNILATGSIGVGKTLGMIVSYVDQILGNFTLRPAMLHLDPKGTFIPRVWEILRKRGMSEHAVHLKLGGDVTINPLYRENPLKDAQFLEVAQMVKAAAANALRGGSSKDSEFWDISAFNLIKNSLAYCYAVHGYTTLEDLYRTMVKAGTENYQPALAQCIDSEKFGIEEKFNIRCSMDYFESEYKQLDNKVRTSILATATSFLNQFQEYQANRLFCPKLEDLTIKSMDKLIDDGKILLFDIANPVLARSMGTFVKLLFEQSVLNRLRDNNRPKDRSVVLIADECQDVITSGSASMISDVTYLAKSREAKAITIMATQSQTSIENALGSEKAAGELMQNFRTRLAAHSSDLRTIRCFQELVGKEERKRSSHSVSENSQRPNRNLILGGYESTDANISESIGTSTHPEDIVTGKEFSRLKRFQCFGLIYDGDEVHFKKLYLRPSFLPNKSMSYSAMIKWLKKPVAPLALALLFSVPSFAFPNVCTVVKSPEFRSCLSFSIGSCMCGWPIPRPCAQFSYYVPKSFIEVMPDPKQSYFGTLPGAAAQLAALGSLSLPFGVEADDDTQSFHAHVLEVPFTRIPFDTLPCRDVGIEKMCFDSMSEHLGSHWSTGSADSLQPGFLAWSLSPKACLLKGAATSVLGSSEGMPFSGSPACSMPLGFLPHFPPSAHSACTGWGTFFPRSGTYHGPSQTVGALMIASRIKSIGSEVVKSTPSSSDEVWQMISPQSSSCFHEGQNVGMLESVKNVRELGRLASGKLTGYLFVVWAKTSCCRDLAEVATATVGIEAMSLACQGLGTI